jgi:hypothetical protein
MTEDLGFDSWQRKQIIPFSIKSRVTLEPTQLPVQLVLDVVSLGIKQLGV